MRKKIIWSSLFLIIVAFTLMIGFFFSFYSMIDMFKKKDVLELSYASIAALITPVISIVLIDISIRGAYLLLKKNEKIKKTYKVSGLLVLLWLLISLPLSWLGSYYLISDNYQKCPPTDLFTQYYTTDLSLCSDPYYEERTGIKR